MAPNALGRHVALIGFMGAGKTTVGEALAQRLGRRFVDVDREVERHALVSIETLFAQRGEAEFRSVEENAAVEALSSSEPAVIALGGGALGSGRVRSALREHAFAIHLEVEPDEAWRRVGGERPLAKDEQRFRALHGERLPVYEQAADGRARDLDGATLAAAGVHVQLGSLEYLGSLVPGDGSVELVADARVAGIYGMEAQLALGERHRAGHEVPAGEEAKSVAVAERLWRDLRLDRQGTVVALGGGCTTDVAGFAAAGYLRGVDWAAVPTTLVGQVDAAIGGKTGVDLPEGKNLVGAFHWPVAVVVDPAVLETLPEVELHGGMSEVVKMGLLAGEPFWELPLPELVRRCGAFKAAVCLRDPHERGDRAILNLGHTFAHALEVGGGYESVSHGRAVALGLLAALRLSGLDTSIVEEVLRPEPVRVDRERAWAALARDKKSLAGVPRLVLLDAPGRARTGVELPDAEVRQALDALIAG